MGVGVVVTGERFGGIAQAAFCGVLIFPWFPERLGWWSRYRLDVVVALFVVDG